MQKPSVVIDNGTGYTKMGYAGNCEPQYIVPTVVASRALKGGQEATVDGVDDLDFYIGNEARAHATTHQVNYPIRHGLIENWDNMVRAVWKSKFKRPSIRGLSWSERGSARSSRSSVSEERRVRVWAENMAAVPR